MGIFGMKIYHLATLPQISRSMAVRHNKKFRALFSKQNSVPELAKLARFPQDVKHVSITERPSLASRAALETQSYASI
jgi:hypothetical protein